MPQAIYAFYVIMLIVARASQQRGTSMYTFVLPTVVNGHLFATILVANALSRTNTYYKGINRLPISNLPLPRSTMRGNVQ